MKMQPEDLSMGQWMTDVPRRFVYFLVLGTDEDDRYDEVRYVGQTTNGLSRVYAHQYTKLFNKIFIIPVPDDVDLDTVEKYFIRKYRPIENVTDNPDYTFMTDSHFKRHTFYKGVEIKNATDHTRIQSSQGSRTPPKRG